jgi:hypothetical protein
MKISPEQLQLSILNQMSKGKAPHPEYYEKLGTSKDEFDSAISDMQENHYIELNQAEGSVSADSSPSSSLDHSKITLEGRNHLSKHFEMTAAYRDLEE